MPTEDLENGAYQGLSSNGTRIHSKPGASEAARGKTRRGAHKSMMVF